MGQDNLVQDGTRPAFGVYAERAGGFCLATAPHSLPGTLAGASRWRTRFISGDGGMRALCCLEVLCVPDVHACHPQRTWQLQSSTDID